MSGFRPSGAVATLSALVLIALPGTASAATITPSTTADDTTVGNCTLREAVISVNNAPTFSDNCAANSNGAGNADTVQLTPGGVYLLELPGSDNTAAAGDLDALVNLTILGNAANPPIISENAGDTDRVLHSPNQTNLTLRNLVVTDGGLTSGFATPQFGGNLLYHGDTGRTLLLDNVDVTSGIADTNNSGDAGGGITVTGGGQVTIQDSLVSGNTAGPSTGGSFQGGGIAVFGTDTDLTVTNSTVSNNSAGVGNITDTPANGSGGGIYLNATGSGDVHTFNNATIDSNHAGGGANGVTGNGGGIVVSGGTQSFTFTGGAISNNTAGGTGTSAHGDGGGLFLGNTGGGPSLTNVNVTGNEAGGDGGSGQGFGGGILVSAPTASTDLTVSGGQVSGNQAGIGPGVASGVGGGIQISATDTAPNSDLTLTGTQVNGNSAHSNGGGIIMQTDTGDLSITGTTVNGNTADNGGGLWREVAAGALDTILRSTFDGNTGGWGGGLHLDDQGTTSITESTISNNSIGANGIPQGGGIFTGSDLTLTNSTVYANHANTATGTGGGIRTGDLPGGAVFVPTLTLNHATLAQNTATGTSGAGGNLYLEGGAGKGQIRASIVVGGSSTDTASSNCFQQAMGVITSNDFNLESTTPTQCNFVAANDLATAANLFLGALGNNGGPTQTVPLLAGSPAINRVTSGCVLTTDQRGTGFVRPQPGGGLCDSGAFEVQDTDADGILDTSDNCPSTPGPASNGGCPLPLVNPPALTPPATTPTTTTRKKCKKKRKGAAAAKKCKRKKK